MITVNGLQGLGDMPAGKLGCVNVNQFQVSPRTSCILMD